jgi:aerobic-type carbon monoxide dehydrogenase small subunit (CoxS/CutS family)
MKAISVHLTVNGEAKSFAIEPRETLLEALRRFGYKSLKKGCGEGNCGACAVIIDGRPRNSCLLFAAQCEGAVIETVEGIGTPEHPHPIQKAFVEYGATQCGYCNPGSILAAKSLLEHNPTPTEAQVKEALDGNLCRCTGYVKRIEAVIAAGKIMAGAKTVRSVKSAPVANPAKTAEPAKSAKPAKPAKSAKPAKLAKTAMTGKTAKTAKTAKTPKAAKTPKTGVNQPPKAAKNAKPARSASSEKAMKSLKPLKPSKPSNVGTVVPAAKAKKTGGRK